MALYQGPAFINKQALLAKLDTDTTEFGRAKEVLLSQLRDPAFNHLFMKGEEVRD